MTTPHHADAVVWASRAPDVPEVWFLIHSSLHGVRHTQRVHIHAQRLLGELGWDEADARLALCAALWHDIGRTSDGVEPAHGADSASRADRLGLTAVLAPREADIVRFAIRWHSLPDWGAGAQAERLAAAENGARRLAEPERALKVLWVLKDADALDRVRLAPWEAVDPAQLRLPATERLIAFAAALYAVLD